LVEQGVHGGHVEERKGDLALCQVGLQPLKVALFRVAPIGGVVGHLRLDEVIEDVPALVHATGHEQVVLFAIIELVDVFERDVVELEIARVAVEAFDELADQIADTAAIHQ